MTDGPLPPLAITPGIRLSFGLAGMAVGILGTGLNFFLLVYYDQVIGLSPTWAGLALALALGVDAVSDPMMGLVSDRLRSRWGRRHPFLWAAVLPMGASYALVWFPPFDAGQQVGLFLWLFGASVLIRLSLTLFDVPGNALIPELTRDYDERTRLSTWKVSSSWMSANIMGILMYAVWLSDDAAAGGGAGSGILRRDGYEAGGLVFAAVITALAALSVLLLRRTVPYLAAVSQRAPAPDTTLRAAASALWRTYSAGPVSVLLLAATFLALAMGLTQALWIYLMSFFWGLGSEQVNQVQLTYLAAAVSALVLLPWLARGRDKRRLALQVSAAFWLVDVAPYALRLLGWWPANGTPSLMPLLLAYAAVDGVLFNMMAALVMSMLTDAVEHHLLHTGRREEGVILAGQTLVTKTSTALGTLLGGLALGAVAFPRGVAPAQVDPAVLQHLGLLFVGCMAAVGVLAMSFLARYSITRALHAEHVARLEGRPPA